MKKIIALASFIAACSFTSAIAQQGNFDPAAMKERQKQQLKESDLKLTDVQIDSVVTINFDFMQQMRGLRDLSPQERQSKIKEVNDAKLKRWTSALKDEALAKKVADFYEKLRQQRMQNGGGPRQ